MKYLLWICLLFTGESHGYVRLTNLECKSYDKTFIDFPVCRLKVLGRGIIGANIHIKFLKLPINRMVVRLSTYRKLSGYHPFLFNVTEEICRALKYPNRLRVFYYFYTAFLPFSNLNHTCPYNDDVLIRNCTLNEGMFSKIPLPKGIYKVTLEMHGAVNWASIINAHFEIDID